MTRVITSSVVRSTHKGESHGGVYLVDLQSGEAEQVVDWNDETISWEGRGADRGLRGIAFHGDAIYLAASDEIFVFSPDFTIIDSFRNAYLKHCHEITIHGDTLYLTSTGFDSILLFDLKQQRFAQGYCLRSLRQPRREGAARLLGSRTRRLVPFDPNGSGGPQAADTFHINSVHVTADGIYLCGTKLAEVLRITPGGALETVARVPEGSHNARPYGEHILLNDTPANRIAILERGGTLL
ncbi:MAG: hypothetical protein GYB64_14540, partial [Chloroflexi bacterium]|nr:hypothetical protein [Chloroflexota bacterium]